MAAEVLIVTKPKWASTVAAILAVSALWTGAASAEEICRDHDARFSELEKRVLQLEEVVRAAPRSPNYYRTSTGAVFRRVERDGFGRAWKAPDGTIWSESHGDLVTDSAAASACAKIGGRLPTRRDFERLRAFFELDSRGYLTEQGRGDLHELFPDMKGRWFWSSSVFPDDPEGNGAFHGDSGAIAWISRVNSLSVRCIGR